MSCYNLRSLVASLAQLALVQTPTLKKCGLDDSPEEMWQLNSPLKWKKEKEKIMKKKMQYDEI